MSDKSRILILGLGSDFGDDQLGFIATRQLAQLLPMCDVRSLQSPLELLDCSADVGSLHVIDACRGAGSPGTIVRFEHPFGGFPESRRLGTHDFGLSDTLKLAEQLHRLPERATIWGVETAVEAGPTSFKSSLSPQVAAAVEVLVSRIAAEVFASHA